MVDEQLSKFLDKHGFQITIEGDVLVLTGSSEIPIVKSFLYIFLGIPIIVFFTIRSIHLHYDGISIVGFLWFIFSLILLGYWIKMLLSTLLQGRKKWVEVRKTGITGPDGNFYENAVVKSLGVRSKKLAGVLSAAYNDNLYCKTIYLVYREEEIDLVSFETRRSTLEKSIEKIAFYIGRNLQIELS